MFFPAFEDRLSQASVESWLSILMNLVEERKDLIHERTRTKTLSEASPSQKYWTPTRTTSVLSPSGAPLFLFLSLSHPGMYLTSLADMFHRFLSVWLRVLGSSLTDLGLTVFEDRVEGGSLTWLTCLPVREQGVKGSKTRCRGGHLKGCGSLRAFPWISV